MSQITDEKIFPHFRDLSTENTTCPPPLRADFYYYGLPRSTCVPKLKCLASIPDIEGVVWSDHTLRADFVSTCHEPCRLSSTEQNLSLQSQRRNVGIFHRAGRAIVSVNTALARRPVRHSLQCLVFNHTSIVLLLLLLVLLLSQSER